MNSSKSSQKHANKISYKPVTAFELYYQLTYMSALASAKIPRNKLFELSARTGTAAGQYFEGINILVEEMRYDYPDAARTIGLDSKSDNIKSFLLRLSDALRSGEPMEEFMPREADAQGEDYENRYERDLESLKQWSNAFSSIIISVSLIIIIQVISAMISSLDMTMMTGLVSSGIGMALFGAWIIFRSAPKEAITISLGKGSIEQKKALRFLRIIVPVAVASVSLMYVMAVPEGVILIWLALLSLPVGLISIRSDAKTNKKDVEFGTFLRSVGGMASSSGTTLKEALTKIDLSSFPTLEPDIERLSKRLLALVEPGICWRKFGVESGSQLINEVVTIFYTGIRIGGDPERVGYLCSLFTAKTAQLRAKRRLNASTFAGLTVVMQGVLAGLMVFVLSIVNNFAILVKELLPTSNAAQDGQQALQLGMANFSAADLQFLSIMTAAMILLLAVVGSLAVLLSDGGYRLKVFMYLALTVFISGVSLIIVPPLVGSILTT